MNKTERQALDGVVDDVRRWASVAAAIRSASHHLPISGAVPLAPHDESLLAFVQGAAHTDLNLAAPLTRVSFFAGRKKFDPAREAADRLEAAHRRILDGRGDSRLGELEAEFIGQAEQERQTLSNVLNELVVLRGLSTTALQDAQHLPIAQHTHLTNDERKTMQSVIELVDLHHPEVSGVLDLTSCAAANCAAGHSSAALLMAVHREAAADEVPARVRAASRRLAQQFVAGRQTLKTLHAEVSGWQMKTSTIRSSRDGAAAAIRKRVADMVSLGVRATLSTTALVVVPVTKEAHAVLNDLRLLRDAPLTAADRTVLDRVDAAVGPFLSAVSQGFDQSWDCTRDNRCRAAHELAATVNAAAPKFRSELDRLSVAPGPTAAGLDELLDPSLGLSAYLPPNLHSPGLVDSRTTELARKGIARITSAAKTAEDAAVTAKTAGDRVRAADVTSTLRELDLEVLRKASSESIRVSALTNAGLTTVFDVLNARNRLNGLPGIGETSARNITQAALRLFEGVREETPVRIDVKKRSQLTAALLDSLRLWDAVRTFEPTKDEVALAKALNTLFRSKTLFTHVLTLVSGAGNERGPSVPALLADALNRSEPAPISSDIWKDFLSRPADYFGMLSELGFVTEDEAKMHGDLPMEIVEAVRALELRREYLTASLRTYQSFGARFALVQEKVVIGDEMGLGKTVEALAMFTHLRAVGHSHFLVVCPAAVVSNWVRETRKHTQLAAHRIHGPMWDRKVALKTWLRDGGVGVTTYDLLTWAREQFDASQVSSVVFDEAHYIKNPHAKRSIASQQVVADVRYVALMTGTPLENSVQEFRNLIGYIRPDLATSAPEYLPSRFRKHVAPAYLRRNQEDVLTELPELVETEEWLGMSNSDEQAYRIAVQDGHFMRMRRAAMLSDKSVKVERLVEIVMEAEANERRVIVFSYFRDVLSDLATILPGEVFGPLTGSTPAADRQRLVDRFSAAGGGAVLIAQVTAGGVGLNIQSASVVVLCEPQLKPTTETQAIARAHRMGQTSTVQVHRLLSENSVDERIRDILAKKTHLFNEFARDSVIAKEAPDAVDVSDAEVARLVIEAERERLFGQTTGP